MKCLAGVTGIGLGVAPLAASFYILRNHRINIQALEGRVEELGYDLLCEAYREYGVDFREHAYTYEEHSFTDIIITNN